MSNTAQDFRRANLIKLIRVIGQQKAVAKAIGATPSYISQLVTGHREIGSDTARKIEEVHGLPRGHMDWPDGWQPKDANGNY